MSKPLVSIIVLCYNHSDFVEEAIQSVIHQEYQPIEMIVVDDASSDESVNKILKLRQDHSFHFIPNDKNLGNCRSFNQALGLSKGKYVIDLAADDLLLSERVSIGVEALENLPEKYGVHFCDTELIDASGNSLGGHYQRNERGKLIEMVPQGEVFSELVRRYFISTPTMMMKKKVLDELGGYDENLTYEDFDFWVRSSRKYDYAFSDKILVKKRILKKSLSTQQRKPGNKHALSTAIVCERAFELCENRTELLALRARIYYELKWATVAGNFKAIQKHVNLLRKIVAKLNV